MAWDTTSVDAMERTASAEADGYCAKCIRGMWLSVTVTHRGEQTGDSYSYALGKQIVTREVASRVIATA